MRRSNLDLIIRRFIGRSVTTMARRPIARWTSSAGVKRTSRVRSAASWRVVSSDHGDTEFSNSSLENSIGFCQPSVSRSLPFNSSAIRSSQPGDSDAKLSWPGRGHPSRAGRRSIRTGTSQWSCHHAASLGSETYHRDRCTLRSCICRVRR